MFVSVLKLVPKCIAKNVEIWYVKTRRGRWDLASDIPIKKLRQNIFDIIEIEISNLYWDILNLKKYIEN